MKAQFSFVRAAVVAMFFLSMFAAAHGQGSLASIAKNPLVGRWKSPEAIVEIRANGTLKINSDEFVYKVKNAVITVANDDGVMTFPYILKGDTLIVEVAGREVVYKRVTGNRDDGEGDVPQTSQRSTGERVIPEFVGKWCYLANLGGTSSYRNDRCFTLYENGTYEYSGEVSSSGAAGSSVGSE